MSDPQETSPRDLDRAVKVRQLCRSVADILDASGIKAGVCELRDWKMRVQLVTDASTPMEKSRTADYPVLRADGETGTVRLWSTSELFEGPEYTYYVEGLDPGVLADGIADVVLRRTQGPCRDLMLMGLVRRELTTQEDSNRLGDELTLKAVNGDIELRDTRSADGRYHGSVLMRPHHDGGVCWYGPRGPGWGGWISGEAFNERPLKPLALEIARSLRELHPDLRLGVKPAGPTTQEVQYQRAVWDAYRAGTDRFLLERAGVAGPDDMEAALASTYLVHEADLEDDPEDTDITLGEHVLHMLAATSMNVGKRSNPDAGQVP